MSTMDELPPDQRAALSVLLRGKSYAGVAAMLGIAERAIHDRAHAALGVLAPREARELDAAGRELVGDYLLGQQPGVAERLQARTLLAGSAVANAWARAVAVQLAPGAAGPLPEIPALDAGAAAAPAAPASAAHAGTASPAGATGSLRSSRLGGALLLAVLAAAIVIAVVLLTAAGGGKHPARTASTGTASTSPSGAETRFALKSPVSGSRSTGTVVLLSENGKKAFYIQAEHIPQSKGFFYAIWLYNSPSSALALSKAPAVGKSHKLAGAAPLPGNAGEFREILLTRETSTRPTRPGHIVLRGRFTVSG